MKKTKWALLGKGLIGSELLAQIAKPKVSERLGLNQTPEYILRSDGFFSASGKKLTKINNKPDVIFVALPSDKDGKLAFSHISEVLKSGGIAITAEKSALANYFNELRVQSDDFNRFGINASVGGGMRMVQIAKHYFTDKQNVSQVHMVVNGTLTSILSLIGPSSGRGVPLGQAVDQAIKLGFAEPGANSPSDVIASEAQGDIPKKTSIFINALNLSSKPIRWQNLNFKINHNDLIKINEEAKIRRPIVSIYNKKLNSSKAESDIIGGFSLNLENWKVVAGFRNVSKNPLFGSLADLTGAGNGIVIGLGPDESDGVITLQGQGAGAKPTVNTMLDDYLAIRSRV